MLNENEARDTADVETGGESDAASVSTFTRRTCGSSSAAARSKTGAIMRHGPHHAAQKSINNGTSLVWACFSKRGSSSASGRRSKRGLPQAPHLPLPSSFSRGMRLVVSHRGQTTCTICALKRPSFETRPPWSLRTLLRGRHPASADQPTELSRDVVSRSRCGKKFSRRPSSLVSHLDEDRGPAPFRAWSRHPPALLPPPSRQRRGSLTQDAFLVRVAAPA